MNKQECSECEELFRFDEMWHLYCTSICMDCLVYLQSIGELGPDGFPVDDSDEEDEDF